MSAFEVRNETKSNEREVDGTANRNVFTDGARSPTPLGNYEYQAVRSPLSTTLFETLSKLCNDDEGVESGSEKSADNNSVAGESLKMKISFINGSYKVTESPAFDNNQVSMNDMESEICCKSSAKIISSDEIASEPITSSTIVRTITRSSSSSMLDKLIPSNGKYDLEFLYLEGKESEGTQQKFNDFKKSFRLDAKKNLKRKNASSENKLTKIIKLDLNEKVDDDKRHKENKKILNLMEKNKILNLEEENKTFNPKKNKILNPIVYLQKLDLTKFTYLGYNTYYIVSKTPEDFFQQGTAKYEEDTKLFSSSKSEKCGVICKNFKRIRTCSEHSNKPANHLKTEDVLFETLIDQPKNQIKTSTQTIDIGILKSPILKLSIKDKLKLSKCNVGSLEERPKSTNSKSELIKDLPHFVKKPNIIKENNESFKFSKTLKYDSISDTAKPSTSTAEEYISTQCVAFTDNDCGCNADVINVNNLTKESMDVAFTFDTLHQSDAPISVEILGENILKIKDTGTQHPGIVSNNELKITENAPGEELCSDVTKQILIENNAFSITDLKSDDMKEVSAKVNCISVESDKFSTFESCTQFKNTDVSISKSSEWSSLIVAEDCEHKSISDKSVKDAYDREIVTKKKVQERTAMIMKDISTSESTSDMHATKKPEEHISAEENVQRTKIVEKMPKFMLTTEMCGIKKLEEHILTEGNVQKQSIKCVDKTPDSKSTTDMFSAEKPEEQILTGKNVQRQSMEIVEEMSESESTTDMHTTEKAEGQKLTEINVTLENISYVNEKRKFEQCDHEIEESECKENFKPKMNQRINKKSKFNISLKSSEVTSDIKLINNKSKGNIEMNKPQNEQNILPTNYNFMLRFPLVVVEELSMETLNSTYDLSTVQVTDQKEGRELIENKTANSTERLRINEEKRVECCIENIPIALHRTEDNPMDSEKDDSAEKKTSTLTNEMSQSLSMNESNKHEKLQTDKSFTQKTLESPKKLLESIKIKNVISSKQSVKFKLEKLCLKRYLATSSFDISNFKRLCVVLRDIKNILSNDMNDVILVSELPIKTFEKYKEKMKLIKIVDRPLDEKNRELKYLVDDKNNKTKIYSVKKRIICGSNSSDTDNEFVPTSKKVNTKFPKSSICSAANKLKKLSIKKMNPVVNTPKEKRETSGKLKKINSSVLKTTKEHESSLNLNLKKPKVKRDTKTTKNRKLNSETKNIVTNTYKQENAFMNRFLQDEDTTEPNNNKVKNAPEPEVFNLDNLLKLMTTNPESKQEKTEKNSDKKYPVNDNEYGCEGNAARKACSWKGEDAWRVAFERMKRAIRWRTMIKNENEYDKDEESVPDVETPVAEDVVVFLSTEYNAKIKEMKRRQKNSKYNVTTCPNVEVSNENVTLITGQAIFSENESDQYYDQYDMSYQEWLRDKCPDGIRIPTDVPDFGLIPELPPIELDKNDSEGNEVYWKTEIQENKWSRSSCYEEDEYYISDGEDREFNNYPYCYSERSLSSSNNVNQQDEDECNDSAKNRPQIVQQEENSPKNNDNLQDDNTCNEIDSSVHRFLSNYEDHNTRLYNYHEEVTSRPSYFYVNANNSPSNFHKDSNSIPADLYVYPNSETAVLQTNCDLDTVYSDNSMDLDSEDGNLVLIEQLRNDSSVPLSDSTSFTPPPQILNTVSHSSIMSHVPSINLTPFSVDSPPSPPEDTPPSPPIDSPPSPPIDSPPSPPADSPPSPPVDSPPSPPVDSPPSHIDLPPLPPEDEISLPPLPSSPSSSSSKLSQSGSSFILEPFCYTSSFLPKFDSEAKTEEYLSPFESFLSALHGTNSKL